MSASPDSQRSRSQKLIRTHDGIAATHVDSCVGVETGDASHGNIASVNERCGVQKSQDGK